MDAIVYIAGYAAHAALKRLSCSASFSTLVVENREIEAENTATIANPVKRRAQVSSAVHSSNDDLPPGRK
ncbi:hypothetical protein V5799_022075 [Amblyomma americanum]|uniref:Uncharacterized protein n=1 Tax=Amblyomma americanum TaxID=6943 RepID=A0AAQ4FLJ9_AMBAM